MALKGNLRDFNIEEILRFIYNGKKSGALEISNGKENVTFYFNSGQLYFVHRPSRPYSVTEKILKSKLLQQDVAEKVKQGKLFPLDSVKFSKEAEEKIRNFMLRDLADLAADVFVWREGEFQFKPGEKRVGEDWGLAVDIDKFIEEVRKNSDIIARFYRYTDTSNAPLRLKQDIDLDEDIILTGKEWRFICALRDGMTIEDVADKLGIGTGTAISTATVLLEKGLIEISPIKSTPEEEKVRHEKKEEKPPARQPEKKEQEQIEKKSEQPEEEESLIDELAAVTGQIDLDKQNLSEEAKKELMDILKSLKNL